jgi:exodeoxyribonuclease VIII
MYNIMVDLETLDTSHSAVVLSIGAVAFDPETGTLGEQLYLEMTEDASFQQKVLGRTISADTVMWWMNQNLQAKQVFFDYTGAQDKNPRVRTYTALEKFSDFVVKHNAPYIWGNGADFDNIILGNLYEAAKMTRPWSYSRNRCFRTLKNLGVGPRKYTRYGTHHNALDDAVTQAEHALLIFKAMRGEG